jgi:hypothetical protein
MAEQTSTRSLAATRVLGAVALLLVGGIHYQQYRYAFYSSVPTIGPLFLLNFIGATVLGLLLLAPIRSRLGRRGELLEQLAALAGVGVAAGGLAALLISEQTPLFGFMEHGYRFVIVLTIASEVAVIALLTLFLIRARSTARGRTAAEKHGRYRTTPPREPVNQRSVVPATER